MSPRASWWALLLVVAPSLAAQRPGPEPLTHGPLLGHVDTTSLHLWARAAAPGDYVLHLQAAGGEPIAAASAVAVPEHDLTLHFAATGLAPATTYEAWITHDGRIVHARTPVGTALADDAGAATVAFGSCADERLHPEQPIWGRLLAHAPQALVLLGDTPYIDLGTVEARRRRHREFFAFAPVAAVLRTIPTWATWDDHDYAANDAYGAVPGSETARPVFVDYHAHASYGDGARGIYTRFRRGPIEVFLLDTRSFADEGPSPLLPAARTLLGRAQIDWLQQGLMASTAPIKVLAGGMVWNDGVRPGKRDHWGTWRAERDALFAWIGEQGLEGVVLVSGDVHRSRVVLHPTAAGIGYELPEFVTSPLAQHVLDANAVAAPGLSFDAGEPHSCLLLAASRGAGGIGLRATFVAGDGREFHVREFAPGDLARSDAATTYRLLVAALRDRLGPDVRLPDAGSADDDLGTSDPVATGAGWRAAVAAAEPELAAWARLSGERRCRFARTSAEPLQTEFMHDLFLGVRALQALNVAAGLQAIADGQPDRLERAARSALVLARHLQQEPGTIAWAVAAASERQAAALAERAAPLGAGVAARMRQLLVEHLARRGGLAAAAVAARLEALHLFEGTLAQLQVGKGAQTAVARRFGAAVRRSFLDHAQPILAAAEALPDEPDATHRAELEQHLGALLATRRSRQRQLDALQRDGEQEAVAASAEAAADLGLLLATMLLPPLPQIVDEQSAARRRLEAATR